MPDIYHNFPINTSPQRVFDGVSTPAGLNAWWSKSASGTPALNSNFRLDFGPGYNWGATVSKFVPGKEFEFTITDSDEDWKGSKVGFKFDHKDDHTDVQFYHTGWPNDNEHYRISTFCWAMYLRILKRNLEFGEEVEYEKRLDV